MVAIPSSRFLLLMVTSMLPTSCPMNTWPIRWMGDLFFSISCEVEGFFSLALLEDGEDCVDK